MSPGLSATLAIGAVLATAPLAIGAEVPTLGVSPTSQDAQVGKEFTVTATLENPGTEATVPLTAHLEVIDPARAGSVDAEDWVPDLNAQVGKLAPGAAKRVRWKLTPIAGGNYAVYVVAIPESAGASPGAVVVSSQAIPVDVREVRTLNAGGAFPVSIAVPVVLLVGLLGLRVRARKAERGGEAGVE